MKALEFKLPPVLIFIFCLMAIYLFGSILRLLPILLPARELVFAFCFVVSGLLGMGGIFEFKKAKTSVHPVDVHKATTVVDKGVYRITRNPMYLGLLLLIFAYAYWQKEGISLLLCLGFIWYMNRFQIEPEERYLEQRFGQVYLDYKAKVRRWI